MPANHYSASLSTTDMAIVRSVPPGGNWKNVPTTIECRRIETIRASFARGEGSRSTYYGRLRPDAPSYTINTYFSRPGNGCHIHYEQDRVLSQREAARLQSFPDSFVFEGSRAAVNRQIGNAVAPLLAYQVARSLGEPGVFIDLFAGAGGLSLGFKWAGWTPLIGNDIDEPALRTYASNVHPNVVRGDIRDPTVADALVRAAKAGRRQHGSSRRCLILGGPPCQGFSTAGKPRSMDDERNQLFWQYKDMVDRIRPDGFVFENVTGLLNMSKGQVFRDVCSVLGDGMGDMRAEVLRTEQHGIPQRRWRVFVMASRTGSVPSAPPRLTDFPEEAALRAGLSLAPSTEQALSDLAPLSPTQDGSALPLLSSRSEYQSFCRGELSPEEYVAGLLERRTEAPELQMTISL